MALHPNIAALYRRKVTVLQSLLDDESSRPQAMEIIRSLVDRIDVTAGPRRGAPQVLLVGALASILDYAVSGQQNAALGGEPGGVCRVLMVAGPETTESQGSRRTLKNRTSTELITGNVNYDGTNIERFER